MTLVSFLWIHTHRWPEWITAISTAVLAVGVLAAVYGLWDSKKTRHGQLTTDVSRRWDEDQTQESIRIFTIQGPTAITGICERLYGAPGAGPPQPGELELWSEILRWPNLIEMIGVLHRQGAISTSVVYRNWGASIARAWVVWEEVVGRLRELDRSPGTFDFFERLALIMEAEARKDAARVARQRVRSARWNAWRVRLRIR